MISPNRHRLAAPARATGTGRRSPGASRSSVRGDQGSQRRARGTGGTAGGAGALPLSGLPRAGGGERAVRGAGSGRVACWRGWCSRGGVEVCGAGQWIGWSRGQREARLIQIANNVGSCCCLGRRAAVGKLDPGGTGRRIGGDWEAKYGHPWCCWKPLSSGTVLPARAIGRPTGSGWGRRPDGAGRIATGPSRCR